MKNTIYDPSKDYYTILKLDKRENSSYEEICSACYEQMSLLNNKKIKTKEDQINLQELNIIYTTLTIPQLKKQYDESMKTYFKYIGGTESKMQKVTETANADDVIIKKAKKEINKKSLSSLILIIALVATLTSSLFLLKEIKKSKVKEKDAKIEAISSEIQSTQDLIANSKITEEITPEINQQQTYEMTAEQEMSRLENIKKSNPDFDLTGIDTSTVYELVKWANHCQADFKETTILSNEYCYSLLASLIDTREYNISYLFNGLDSQENINKACEVAFQVQKNNNSFDDEIKACETISNCVKQCDKNNYPEAIALTAIIDKTMDLQINYFDTIEYLKKNNPQKAQEFEILYDTTLNRFSNNWILKDTVNKALEEDSYSLKRG